MSGGARIEPLPVVELVEAYVYSELQDAKRYDNRTPLDDSGIFSLHRLAAEIYAAGYADGERAESRREGANRLRARGLES